LGVGLARFGVGLQRAHKLDAKLDVHTQVAEQLARNLQVAMELAGKRGPLCR
jgi:hypothetical protein